MSVPTTPRAYDDCYDIFDQALADEVGVKVSVPSYEAANHLRMRMNTARSINRKGNMLTYPMDHPMFNASAYDVLVCQIKHEGGQHFLYVKRRPKYAEVVPLSGEAPAEDEVIEEVVEEPIDDLAEAVAEEAPPPQVTSLRRV